MSTLLEVKNLTRTFDGLLAVDDFSVSVEKGSVVGLIGPNGAGKTTAFNMITGFLETQQGEIHFQNQNITRLPAYKIARAGIARTFQDLRLITRLSVLDNVLLAPPKQSGEAFLTAVLNRKRSLSDEDTNRKKALEILDFVGLAKGKNNLASDLSYGQQKLLTLACCLATEAELLLLDEPVSGIHPNLIEQMLDLFKKLVQSGKTILFIEHNIQAVMQVSDHVVVMDNGKKISEGPPSMILENKEILEAYLE